VKVKGKVVLVTGGGSGLGRQLVLNLLAKGARVAAADINMDALDEVRHLADPHAANLSLHQADVSNRDAVSRLAEEAVKEHGCVDAIVNNAGVIHPFKPVNELDFRVVDKVIGVNLYGVINVTKTFLPLLLQRPEAHITNVSSLGGLLAFPCQTLYGATKAAVKLFSEGLYVELRDTNVGVTVVFPGAMDTDITRNSGAHMAQFDKLRERFRGTTPQDAARRIVEGMENGRFSIVIGADAGIMRAMYWLQPRGTLLLINKVMKMALPG
jgi:NAD(P)-dependent dehydrogenase (short-subunit alcohol dehydrogenase family)